MERFNVIGAGLSGCTIARLLKDQGHDVHIYEKKNVIGGNCYDERIDGICVHKYGPHIFHTNDKEVWEFVNRFTEFELYQHKVLAYVDGSYYPLPCKRDEDWTYDNIVKNYTHKMRGFHNKDAVKRFSYEDRERYFGDQYQGIPKQGYTKMLENMIEGIPITLNCKEYPKEGNTIYTGRIDEYYWFIYGELDYHKTRFDTEKHTGTYQEVSQVNYPNDYDFIRITEHKHRYKDTKGLPHTILTKEYPRLGDTPCYPVSNDENKEKYSRYKELADKDENIYFLGRLATYEYLDMWKIIRNALDLSKKWSTEH